jgi:hypothetical protein
MPRYEMESLSGVTCRGFRRFDGREDYHTAREAGKEAAA